MCQRRVKGKHICFVDQCLVLNFLPGLCPRFVIIQYFFFTKKIDYLLNLLRSVGEAAE